MTTANSKASAQAAPSTTATIALRLVTPEECFSVPGPGIPVDVVNCCLNRAESTLRLLMRAGDDGEFDIRHDDIMGALWGITAWVEMAQKALNGRSEA